MAMIDIAGKFYNAFVREPVSFWTGKDADKVEPLDAFPVYAGAALWPLALLGIATGCSDDGSEKTGDAGGDSDVDGDSDTDADADSGVDAGSIPSDPWEREGFNGKFVECVNETTCTVLDIDIYQEQSPDTMHLMTAYPHNRKATANLVLGFPMNSPEISYGSGEQFDIQAIYNGWGEIHSKNVSSMSEGFLVPFETSKPISETEINEAIGLASIDELGDVAYSLVDEVAVESESDAGAPFETEAAHPVKVGAGVELGGTFFVSASEELTGDGMLMAFDINEWGAIGDPPDSYLGYIPTSGKYPVAVAAVGEDSVAVLNTEDEAGVSIDIANVDSASITGQIPLASYPKAVALGELPISDDGEYAVAAVGSTGDMSTLLFVDMDLMSVVGSTVGSTEFCEGADIRDIILLGTKAYVSVENACPKQDDDEGTTGKVAVLDFSDPTSPVVERLIDVGYDVGSIGVHGSGIVYVAVTDRWWEVPGTAENPWSYVVAFDPARVTDDRIAASVF